MAKRGRRKQRSKSQSTQPAASTSSAAQETEDPSHRISGFVNGSLPILQSAIEVASEAAGDAAVPGLSIGLSALAKILEHIEAMQKTVEGVNTLQERIAALSKLITDFYSRPQAVPEGTKQRIAVLSKTWEDVAQKTKYMASRGRVKRFFRAKYDADKLEGFIQDISDSIQQNFLLGSLLSIEVGVTQANENILGFRKDMRVFLDESFMPTYAKGAQFDAFGPKNVRGACLKGTRVKTLEEVFEWITDTCLREGATVTRSIYWYNGWAGTGKTTIACSIAEWCLLKGILAASFFCSRFDAECSNPYSIFRTISRQICCFSLPFKEKVAAILAKDPTIIHSAASRQFKELILRPLQELKRENRHFPRCVVVIDALDECSDPQATSIILKILAESIPDIAPFLMFVATSRPERHITSLFESALRDVTTPCLLHMVELESVSNDIRHYLETSFAELRNYFELGTRPSSSELARLVELSAGLFIWAATAVRFVRDEAVSDPEGQLNVLLSIQPTAQDTEQTSQTILDSLYSEILQAAFPRTEKALSQRLQSILGTIVLAQEPLSVAALEGLTGVKGGLIRNTLLKIHSVLYVPDTNHEPIRIIHPTFAEFLLHLSPSKSETFVIDSTTGHTRILLQILGIFGGLKPNIADLPTTFTSRSDVANLSNILKERIPAALSYSCRQWSTHLEQCGGMEQVILLFNSLDNFFRTRLLNWLEVCGLLGGMDSCIAALQTARRVCVRSGEPFVPLVDFIVDCLRFTQTYSARINDIPLQLYHSLIAFAPDGSLVKQQYAQQLTQSLLITRGAPPDWGPCVEAFVGHDGSMIFSVSLSGDGAYFATGGGDGYIRIWRTATRTSVKAIPAGDGRHRVAFSPDGTHVASAPNLHIWDVKTGNVVHTLEHEGAEYVAYSADGTRLASGSGEEIKLWDTSTGTCLDTTTSVCAGYGMAISRDRMRIGGSTAQGYPALYDTSSESKAPEILDQSNGHLAAFSPDGHYAASCASSTVTVWALHDKSTVRTASTSRNVLHAAFSHDSTQIGCGCKDRCVYIWTVASDDSPRVFTGHTDYVRALAWSLDDTQVISVGDDGTIRVWDLTRHRSDTTLTASPPSSPPPLPGAPCYAVLRTPMTTALFSLPAPIQPLTAASDAPILTLYADMADAWDAILRGGRASGEFAASRDWAFLTGRLYANMNQVWPVVVASDGLLVAYVPAYKEVKAYSCRAVPQCLSLSCPSFALALSFDNTRLAGAEGQALSLWDVTSQYNSPIKEFELDSSSTAIAFSHNCSLLVAGTNNSDAHIYNTTTGKSINRLHGTRGKVTQVAFSADDRHVIAQAHPWLIIWDVETGDQILEFTLTHNHLLHSFDFAADDTGILISDAKGGTTKLALWSPGDRTWPAYAVTEDGWLYAKGPGKVRRLCWLPPEWRSVFSMGGPKFCALDLDRDTTVVFDVSRIPEYVEAWGVGSEA